MAYIRTHETKRRDSRGRPIKTYTVEWREVIRDDFGLPQPKYLNRPDGPSATRFRRETYASRPDAEARRDEINAARHVTGTASMADQRKAGDLPFGHYARAWIDSQKVKAATGDKLRGETVDGYAKRLSTYALPEFGPMAIGAITPAHCEQFLVRLVSRGLSPSTLKHHWSVTRNVFLYALRHRAISANPIDAVDFASGSNKRRHKRHHPLTSEQVAAVAASVGTRYPVYELMTLFVAYTGLRSEEIAGLEIGDLAFVPSAEGLRAHVSVRRAKKRAQGAWITDGLKSDRSERVVPLPGWLAQRMRDYLDNVHLRSTEPAAPLWPNRVLGGSRHRGRLAVAELDFSEPVDPGAYYKNVLQPALAAVDLPASTPAQPERVLADGSKVPASPKIEGVRLHDLRHTFATLQLSAGVHFMQVSKWLGHSTFTLTLDTYGDWIPEADGGVANALPEPVAPAIPAKATVLPFRRQSS
ncbi:tyrosine-type recombinase/integrase [Mycobacterium kyogaense]|uniref:tyrosine-type recombinase/integrase n=1 Tax=Mycobacterium kyogaense TaxID=2212479 RepID=UPI000DAC794A|nr:site-specific integrase [Mycobacterium kyogaense]